MKNISKIISITLLLFSVIIFLYVFYRNQIIFAGVRFDFYLKYYVISSLLIFISIISFFLDKEIKIKIFILLILTFSCFYLIEGYLVIKNKYDTRTKYQLYDELKKENPKIVVKVSPHLSLQETNQTIFPLAGISNRKTINCNESGYYSIYQSDRYGFNNLDPEWDKEQILFLLLGDSFVHGACVKETDTIGGNLRKNIKDREREGILNLGQAGNGPLIEYATLREYLPIINAKRVLWIYYERNDLKELLKELNNKLLLKYLSDQNFIQNLYLKQNIIDLKQTNKLSDAYKSISFNIPSILRLHLLRSRTIDKFSKPNPANKIYFESTILKFKEILKLSKDFTEEKGARFYFVYLPDYFRYKKKNLFNNTTYDYQRIIQIVNDLDIPIIDINKELFNKHEDPLSLFPFRSNLHFNELGYRLISETIFKKIHEHERINN